MNIAPWSGGRVVVLVGMIIRINNVANSIDNENYIKITNDGRSF